VVNLYLSAADLHKLRQEIAVRSGREIRKDTGHESISGWNVHQPGMKEYGHPMSVDNAHFAWTSADWLAYN
jgi:hypothetical protein